jgi:hypothetical protein
MLLFYPTNNFTDLVVLDPEIDPDLPITADTHTALKNKQKISLLFTNLLS